MYFYIFFINFQDKDMQRKGVNCVSRKVGFL